MHILGFWIHFCASFDSGDYLKLQSSSVSLSLYNFFIFYFSVHICNLQFFHFNPHLFLKLMFKLANFTYIYSVTSSIHFPFMHSVFAVLTLHDLFVGEIKRLLLVLFINVFITYQYVLWMSEKRKNDLGRVRCYKVVTWTL
jgi:hypothetical protein